MIAGLVFGFLALLGTLITSVQALLVRRFRRPRAPFGAGLPSRQAGSFLSILKPVCGLDDELEENLLSFTRLRDLSTPSPKFGDVARERRGVGCEASRRRRCGTSRRSDNEADGAAPPRDASPNLGDGVLSYEVLISAEEWDDPALEVARRVMRAHPFAPFRIVVDPGSRNGVVNRKVERLIAAAREAKGDILLISDSNVRVEPDDLAQTLVAFDDPRVGCVSNLFIGSGARTLGASIESLHLLSFVTTGAVLAATAGVPCVVGKSMAVGRDALAAIGGFERFRRVLAEDQAIGLAIRDAGYHVALSPIVVRNIVVHRTLQRALDRQVRWNKIRYAFSHRLYAGELLLNPLFFALLAIPIAPWLPVVVATLRCAQIAILSHTTRAALTWQQIALTPLLDLLMLYAWFVPFFSNSVTWRGYRARVGRDTELIAA